jgi:hypothetical protein
MEHRYATRKPLRLDVDVYHRDELLGRFKTRNINDGGVFVETGTHRLRRSDVVRVSFVTGRSPDLPRSSLKAMVVHRTGNGAGMMFLGVDSASLQTRRALVDLAA